MTGASEGDKSYATEVMKGASTALVKLVEQNKPGMVTYSSEGVGRSGMYRALSGVSHIILPDYTGIVLNEVRGDKEVTDSDGNTIIRKNVPLRGNYGIVKTEIVLLMKELAKNNPELKAKLDEITFLEKGLMDDDDEQQTD